MMLTAEETLDLLVIELSLINPNLNPFEGLVLLTTAFGVLRL